MDCGIVKSWIVVHHVPYPVIDKHMNHNRRARCDDREYAQ